MPYGSSEAARAVRGRADGSVLGAGTALPVPGSRRGLLFQAMGRFPSMQPQTIFELGKAAHRVNLWATMRIPPWTLTPLPVPGGSG